MNEYLFGVLLGLPIVALLLVYFIGPAILRFLAERNIFWTIVGEGTAKAIMKFGKFHHFIMAYKGYKFDGEWNVVEGKEESDKKSGLVWIGIPFVYSVYTYTFKWTSFVQKEKDGELVQEAEARKKMIDYILLKDDIYYAFIRSAETKGMVPIDVDLLLTIRVVNPYRALFWVEEWLEATQNQFMPVLRSYIGQKEFEELKGRKEGVIREKEGLLGDVISDDKEPQKKGRTLGDFLQRHYGVRVKKVGIVKMDPSGERGEKYQEAASKKWEANKEVQRINEVYGAIKGFGDVGVLLKAFEAMETVGKGPSNLVIFPLGSAKELLQGWTGGKTDAGPESGKGEKS